MKSQIVSRSQRRQIQHAYERALIAMSDPSENRLLVHQLLSECVIEDLSTPMFISTLLENLGTATQAGKTGRSVPAMFRQWVSYLRNWRFFRTVKRQPGKEAIRFGLRALYRQPHDLHLLCTLAEVCLSADMWVVAECYLRHALAINANSQQAIELLARSLLQQARFEESLDTWQQLQPGRAEETQISQIIDCLQTHLPASSQTEMETWKENCPQSWLSEIEQNPTSAELYLKLSAHLIQQRRWNAADDLLNRGLAATGARPELLEQLETIRLESCRHQQQIAAQLNSINPQIVGIDALNDLQWEFDRTEMQVFERRTRSYPSDFQYPLQLAACLRRLGNFEAALKQLDQIPDNEQTRFEAALERGKCHQHLHQFAAAVAEYDRLINNPGTQSEPPIYEQALYHGALLTAAMGNGKQAQRWLSRLLEFSPDYQDARDRLDKIVAISDNSGNSELPSGAPEGGF
ncbi:MAG TPA: hypothetical protein EYN70_11970 [Planctomycetaceae bacterium]|nr:hypothetical protein [Planctomycetaceae bacterium]